MLLRFLKKSAFWDSPVCRFGRSISTCAVSGAGRTAVLSFGDGSNGALGLPFSYGADAYEPTRVPGLPANVSNIGAGHYHSLAVTDEGQVWAWGRNEEGQLGRGVGVLRDTWNLPTKVEGLDNVRIKAAFASGVASMAIGYDGSLWVWGRSKRGQLGLGKGITESVLPRMVEALAGEEIVKVSLGWGHALAQTKDGKLFGWGYAAEGRLGQIGVALEKLNAPVITDIRTSGSLGKHATAFDVAEQVVLQDVEKEKNMAIAWEPFPVEELYDQEVIDIACGLDHSLVLCCDGKILSSGNNIYGQLGRPTDASQNMLAIDTILQAISVSAGLGHSFAVCQTTPLQQTAGEDRGVLSWGWNCSSQLGRDGAENLPGLVEGLQDETPISVSCGRVHSMILTSKRQIWVWGSGKNGRLGLGSSGDEPLPTLLDTLDCEVLQVASGFDHNVVLVAE